MRLFVSAFRKIFSFLINFFKLLQFSLLNIFKSIFFLELLDNNHLVNQNYMNFNTDLSRIVNNPKLNVETISDNSLSNLNEWEEIDNHNFTTFGTTMASYRNDIDNVFLLQKPRKNAKLEMGVNSQILIMAGTYNYLYFDITNIDTETILYNIQVTDEKRYLIHLSAKR